MGKKRSAARRAAATAAASVAPTSPAIPLDAYTAPVDTPAASAVRESPTNTQQPRVSHEADATRAPRAASPAHIRVDTKLLREPASPDARADTPVAIATPQTHAAHELDSCPVPRDAPPALTTPTSTSNDVPTISAQQPRVSTTENTPAAQPRPLPALSGLAAAAAADLATAIAHMGPPDLYIASPVHDLDRLDASDPELESSAPRTSLATSVEDIDEELLTNIIEDAQRTIRIAARRDVRTKALAEGRERGLKEGIEEGKRLARIEARAEVRRKELAWKDGYEQGRWEGYREGLEVARTEVSTLCRADASVQADISNPPHSPPVDMIPTTSHTDACVQFDVPTLTSSSRADTPLPVPDDTSPMNPRVDAHAQTDNAQFPAHINLHVQTHAPASTCAIPHISTGVQAEDPQPPVAPPSPPDSMHTLQFRVQASTQTDNPHVSTPARATTVHEIEPDLLREIIATAKAKGEADGLKRGKHVGFQDGMEAGWKSGTREGHKDGYSEGEKAGIEEGCEQFRLEVSRIPRAVAVVQTDYVPLPTSIDSTMQTIPTTGAQHASSMTFPTTIQPCTFIPTSCDDNRTSHMSSMTSNDISMSHNNTSFSWADEASSLPIITPAPLISPPPRDFSGLRSSSARPFDSLKRRARRSQARPTRPSHPPRPFVPSSEPIITRRHPAGLRADRPAVVVSPSLPIPHLVKLDTPPLDWQGDPRLQELGRVLRGLGWVYGLGS